MRNDIKVNELQLLRKQIASNESNYNAEICMLRSPFSSPGYHTTIKEADFIHSTNHSLIYALGLLDTEMVQYEQRAFDILKQVISLQDRDRSRNTFGIWPWFYEESLDQMSPPDWNWADFCGKQLVLVISRHGQRLPAALYEEVKQSICCACDAIILRNIGPHYTNIAIMGAFVTLIAGELFGIKQYEQYGIERLRKLNEFTQINKAFQEFNSPTYTTVAITELSKIAAETCNKEAKQIAESLLDLVWSQVSSYFHAATRQWSGPHSRCYHTLLDPNHQVYLQMATEGEISFFSEDEMPYNSEWYKAGIRCPEKYRTRFSSSETRELHQKFTSASKESPEKWAYTYMTADYSLGSFNREIMWNQTRTLLAYINNGGEPVYAHLRFLHDGYDYCSAIFHGVQKESHVLFGISFVTDGGDTHPNLDMIDGTITAKDLCIRLELYGCLEGIVCDTEDQNVQLKIGKTTLQLSKWYAAFEEDVDSTNSLQRQGWQVNKLDNGKLALDFVIYRGEAKQIDFRQLQQAAFVGSLSMNSQGNENSVEVTDDSGLIKARSLSQEEDMVLTLPLKPIQR
ncbi:hypothetical protein [Paenibacillus sp. GXUN7292]|uniref:hypothetical protein n=1 Tax=Paenibacillus sp. GXUN7292 TaxID=3422499 RepID=UPI003D7C84EC